MSMSPIVRDAWMLRKLLEKATGIKVYKAELGSSSSFNLYRGIVQEYKDETNSHITVAQGSWHISEGGEYKVSLYTPTITVGNKRMINAKLVRNIANNIVDALNSEFGQGCWNTCNEEQRCWLPLSRLSFYLQIPNFEEYK